MQIWAYLSGPYLDTIVQHTCFQFCQVTTCDIAETFPVALKDFSKTPPVYTYNSLLGRAGETLLRIVSELHNLGVTSEAKQIHWGVCTRWVTLIGLDRHHFRIPSNFILILYAPSPVHSLHFVCCIDQHRRKPRLIVLKRWNDILPISMGQTNTAKSHSVSRASFFQLPEIKTKDKFYRITATSVLGNKY